MTKGLTDKYKECEYCGKVLPNQHGLTQKYHKECARDAYKKRKRTTSANLSDEQREKRNAHQRWLTTKNRRTVIDHYGEKCQCCGEERIEFLCIDHIFGNGNKHRKQLGITGGNQTVNWLIKTGFPSGFRVLCYNCNMAYGFYGKCPHNN